VESQLCERLPDSMWTLASDVQILHGRRVCRPSKPLCEQCPVADDCHYFQALQREARGAKPTKAAKREPGKKKTARRKASRT